MVVTAPLVLDDDQELLRTAARDLVEAHSPFDAIGGRRASDDEGGFDRDLWRRLADLGWAGITLPESAGGAGGRLADLAVILEQLGRTLTPTPYLSTVLLSGGLLREFATPAQRDELIPRIVSGELLMAVALQDGDHHSLSTSTTAVPTDQGWTLTGEKRLVVDGHIADRIVVLAAGSGTDDRLLFIIEPRAAGVEIGRRRTLDHRIVADIRLDAVAISPDDVLDTTGREHLVDLVVDAATAGLCAEMLGSTAAIFERTVQYLKDRIQFDVPIGSFQALQHRVAILHCELELARALVMDAVRAVDAQRPDRAATVSAAKATMSDLFRQTSAEALQLHGGIGMTAEAAPGRFVKRARVTNTLLGDATFHRRRFATESGWLSPATKAIEDDE